MIKKITKKDIKRMDEIYENAIDHYLDKVDADVMEYASQEDRKEYKQLYQRINGECPFCGESSDDVCFDNWEKHNEKCKF